MNQSSTHATALDDGLARRPTVQRLVHGGLTQLLAGFAALGFWLAPANAIEIERVISPGGVEAWLVEDRTVPIVAVEFSFAGGTAQDPLGKGGLVNLLARTLDEGAGELDAIAFQTALQDNNVSLGFNADRDRLSGSMRALSAALPQAFELTRLALAEPRFDPAAVDRMKESILAGLRRDAEDASTLAGNALAAAVFPNHPYGRPRRGTVDEVSTLTREDVREAHRHLVARDELRIAVVGAIDATTLAGYLDSTFVDLPELGQRIDVPMTQPETGVSVDLPFEVPQTSIRLVLPGPLRHDPDFLATFVMNHILGGGSFTSRLYKEIREVRGLAYSIGTYLIPYDYAGLIYGATGTRADRASLTVEIIDRELRRMALEGPSVEELEAAKRFLTGSYALRFDSSSRIAAQLLAIQEAELGIDYVDRRNAEIAAVTLADVQGAAQRFLADVTPSIARVGLIDNGAEDSADIGARGTAEDH